MSTRITAFATCLAVATCLFSVQTSAQVSEDQQDQSSTSTHPLIEAVAKAENLTTDEALDFLDRQDRNLKAIDSAKEIAGQSFGGAWIDQDQVANVAITDPSIRDDIEESIKDTEINIKEVNYTNDELFNAFSRLSDLKSKDPDLLGVEIKIDEISNKVTVSIPPSKPLIARQSPDAREINSSNEEDDSIEEFKSEVKSLETTFTQSNPNKPLKPPIVSLETNLFPTMPTPAQGCSNRVNCFPYFRGGLRIDN